MRTPRLFLGIFALALLLPLLLLACGGSDEPTDTPSSERATAEPTDLPDSEQATDEPETPASPGRTPSTPGSGDAPTATDTPVPTATTAPPAASGSVETDREALVALYNATDGENWYSTYNWLSDAPLGEWEVVGTNDDGRVTSLGLAVNNLSGEIPAELGSLSNLRVLYLYSNELSGEIPAELGSLSNLRVLDLHSNELSGEIPAELGSLSNLQWLDLSYNDLSGGIPAELGSLSNLTELHLSGNELSGCVPRSIQVREFVLSGLRFC